MLTRCLLACVMVALMANGARATTIVVARSANEIVIGADSKVTDVFGNELNRRACKIRQVGNLFVAIEGLEVDRQTGFSAPEIATRALTSKASAPAAEKMSLLMGYLVSALLTELAHLKT